jgi:hypothetical protein
MDADGDGVANVNRKSANDLVSLFRRCLFFCKTVCFDLASYMHMSFCLLRWGVLLEFLHPSQHLILSPMKICSWIDTHQWRVSDHLQSPPARKKGYAASSLRASIKQEIQSSSPTGTTASFTPRRGKGSKFYAVRIERRIGVFESWAECRAMDGGWFQLCRVSVFSYPMEGRRFHEGRTRHEESKLYEPLFIIVVRRRKSIAGNREGPPSRRDRLSEYLCCLDSGADVNLASRQLLHDVHPIRTEGLSNCGEVIDFAEEGTLRLFASGTVRTVPALVATAEQFPSDCDVLLGIPGLDDLGVHLDEHRAKKLRRLECFAGEKMLRT